MDATQENTEKKAPRELAQHEKNLFSRGNLIEHTHKNCKYRIFFGELGRSRDMWDDSFPDNMVEVYRHMGDCELQFLLQNGQLPATQPYQTVVEGVQGFQYCMKYFNGQKSVDTHVVTVIEFCCPTALVQSLFHTFHKAEDGCLSTGLGSKAGNTLNVFNCAQADGRIRWTPVFVRRLRKKKKL